MRCLEHRLAGTPCRPLQGTGLDGIIVSGTFFVYCNTSSGSDSGDGSVTNAQAVTGDSLTGTDEPYCYVRQLHCPVVACGVSLGTSGADDAA